MEKKFVQSAFLSTGILATGILVVYAIASPPLHISAQSATSFNESAPFRKGVVQEMSTTTGGLLVSFDGFFVPVVVDASTTVTAPNGTETELSSLRDGSAIYIFGNYNKDSQSIEAKKIVMRNKSHLERKTLSRMEMQIVQEAQQGKKSPTPNGLTLQQ